MAFESRFWSVLRAFRLSSALRNLTLGVGAVAVAGTASGCVIERHDHGHDPTYAVGPGTLLVDWTIDGRADPAECQRRSSTALEITVYGQNGESLGVYQQDCEALVTSITLNPGSYSASALLIDRDGNARTTTLDLDPFRILGDDQLSTPIDFPASSFY